MKALTLTLSLSKGERQPEAAKNEGVIRKHGEISGFPATKITAVRKMIDPTTERES